MNKLFSIKTSINIKTIKTMKYKLQFQNKLAAFMLFILCMFSLHTVRAQDCVSLTSLSTAPQSFMDGSTLSASFTGMQILTGTFSACGVTASPLYTGVDGIGEITLTFSVPYTGNIELTSSAQDIAEFYGVFDNTNMVDAPPTLGPVGCLAISGFNVTGTLDGTDDPEASGGTADFAVTNTTSVTVTFGGGFNGSLIGLTVCMPTMSPCDAGTASPTLSATTLTNVCPATTADLTSITASNTPVGTTLTWHTATPATTANLVTDETMVAAGTYHAAFFDATNNCYSGTGGDGSATTSAAVTIVACCAAGEDAPSFN